MPCALHPLATSPVLAPKLRPSPLATRWSRTVPSRSQNPAKRHYIHGTGISAMNQSPAAVGSNGLFDFRPLSPSRAETARQWTRNGSAPHAHSDTQSRLSIHSGLVAFAIRPSPIATDTRARKRHLSGCSATASWLYCQSGPGRPGSTCSPRCRPCPDGSSGWCRRPQRKPGSSSLSSPRTSCR